MDSARRASCALLLALCACASGAHTPGDAAASCARTGPQSHLEVYLPRATVVRVLGMRDSRSGMHEGFIVQSGSFSARVEDNADITGAIPLRRGESISLLGQYECDDGVIHWTHHDPGGRHTSGYVEADGKRYQ